MDKESFHSVDKCENSFWKLNICFVGVWLTTVFMCKAPECMSHTAILECLETIVWKSTVDHELASTTGASPWQTLGGALYYERAELAPHTKCFQRACDNNYMGFHRTLSRQASL